MEKITRKGIAFDKAQLKEFDKHIEKKGYKNRSEAIRDLIRNELIEQDEKNPETEMMATLTLVYSHNEHHVQHNLTHVQHTYSSIIRSTLHIHMDAENCMEVLILEGKVKNIKKLSDMMIAEKGVKHGKIFFTKK